ncbi:MAG TPA: cyclophane-forming radical SAM/SPASM peptide maturase GrrM/OscB, partial [Chthoniobacterales bacterium]
MSSVPLLDPASAPPEPGSLSDSSWLKLVVLQPSPFCNINCDYCYLTRRGDTHRMSRETLQRAVEEIFASDLIAEQVTFVWHAGEPLAVPIPWYEEAFDLIARHAPPQVRIGHSFQSNGTLLNEKWCRFIRDRGLSIGLSLDGPAFIHDAHRVTRQGAGTHALAMRGANQLREHGIFFNVIAVVTRESLDHPDAIFDFFLENGMHHVGFNIEELEGGNTQSSLQDVREDRIAAFFRRIFERQKAEKGKVRIREFDSALARILGGSGNAAEFVYENEQVRPFGILSVDWQGNFSTYSPELLGLES